MFPEFDDANTGSEEIGMTHMVIVYHARRQHVNMFTC